MNTNKTIVIIGLICLLMMIVVTTTEARGETTTEARAETLNGTGFSIDIPDNWVYEEFTAAVSSTPNEFGVILLNAYKPLEEQLKDEGVYSRFEQDYTYVNIPLDLYVKYKLDKQHSLNVTDKQNVTVDGEPAVKIYGNGIKEFTDTKVVEYLLNHDDKSYYLGYLANVKDFEKYLPEFEQMVKTFKFVNIGE